jgi:hypothetical protein
VAIIRVVAELTRSGVSVGANVFHFQVTTPELDGAQASVDALETFYDSIKGVYTSTTTITIGSVVATVGETPNRFVDGVTPAVVNGTGATDAQPNNSAALITWRTGLAGRSRRGRSYLGPFRNGITDGDGRNLQSSFRDAFQAAADQLVDDASGPGGTTLVVWSEVLQVATAVANGLARTYLGSMRTRL